MNLRLSTRLLRRALLVALISAGSVGCQYADLPKHLVPIPGLLVAKMRLIGVDIQSPIYVRIFKEESEIEIWKQQRDGTYTLLTNYPICRWSGVLGPKIAEGDRQAPEGFYTVTPAQMNPDSIAYLAFNIGYPNAFDRSLGRTGANLMVHGACSSAGCYALTDEDAGEVFAIAREAFEGGQRSFEVHAFPFRMTAENMARHSTNEHMEFWWMLKEGYDSFEVTRTVPTVNVCDRRYVFNANPGLARFEPAGACPAYTVAEPTRTAVARRSAAERLTYQNLIARMGGQTTPAPAAAIASVPAPAGAAPADAALRGLEAPLATAAIPLQPVAQGDVEGGAAPVPRPRPGDVAIAAVPASAPASQPVPVTAPVAAPVDFYRSLFAPGPLWGDAPAPPAPAPPQG